MLRYDPTAEDATDVTSHIDTERFKNRKRKGPIRPATPAKDHDDSKFAAFRAITYAQDLAAGYGPTDDTETGETLPPWKQSPQVYTNPSHIMRKMEMHTQSKYHRHIPSHTYTNQETSLNKYP